MADPLDGFERSSFTAEGATRTVYRTGVGPAVIVISELPGITPSVAEFARTVAGIGCTAVLPHLFGEDGRPPSAGYTLASLARTCVSREFTILALGRTSPITTWLRALARDEHGRCGGPGVGAVGMCLTGGFALAMMVDEVVLAPVLSQPSLPFPLGAARRRAIGISDADTRRVVERVAAGVCVLGLRFTRRPDLAARTLRDVAHPARRRVRRDRARLLGRQSPRPPPIGALGAHRGPRRPAGHPDPPGAGPGARPVPLPVARVSRPSAATRRAPGQAVATTSPWSTANQASGAAAHRCHACANDSRSAGSAMPWARSWSASEERVKRSAQRPPHQVRSSAVAKHQAEAEGRDLGEAGGTRPPEEQAAGVPVGPVDPGQGPVRGEGPVELGIVGGEGHRRVVAVPDRHQAPRPADPSHLDEGGHRIPHVLEHLVGMDHVEGAVGKRQPEQVGDQEGDRDRSGPGGESARLADDVDRGVDADHPSGGHRAGQVAGERARSAPDVEQVLAGPQVREQVGGRVGRGAPAVRAQDALVVAVGVGRVRQPLAPRRRRPPPGGRPPGRGCRWRRAPGRPAARADRSAGGPPRRGRPNGARRSPPPGA